MRGRTLNDSFIILDEAQNTSPEQMQMFLTRLGFGSKVVVTGDVTQIDLPREQASGLIQVQDILGDDRRASRFVRFGHEDVVRHKLVQRIVEAYKLHAEETGTQRASADGRRSRSSNRSGVEVDEDGGGRARARACSPPRASTTASSGSRSSAPDEIRDAEARAPRHRRGDGRALVPDRRHATRSRRACRAQLGDVVLCPQVVGEGGGAPLVHGLLHLLGYDHGAEMEAREEALR